MTRARCCGGRWGAALRQWLEAVPPGAHICCSARVTLLATAYPYLYLVPISSFESRSDLIACLAAGSHVPGASGGGMSARLARDRGQFIDGNFWHFIAGSYAAHIPSVAPCCCQPQPGQSAVMSGSSAAPHPCIDGPGVVCRLSSLSTAVAPTECHRLFCEPVMSAQAAAANTEAAAAAAAAGAAAAGTAGTRAGWGCSPSVLSVEPRQDAPRLARPFGGLVTPSAREVEGTFDAGLEFGLRAGPAAAPAAARREAARVGSNVMALALPR